MGERTYEGAVAELLRLGDVRGKRERPDYLGLGLGPEHVAELVRMSTDPALNGGDPESPDVWAPVHAWRALGELRAEEAVAPLLSLLDDEEDDYAGDELPKVFGRIGPAAIPALTGYLEDERRPLFGRIRAATALEEVGKLFPEARDACVAILVRALEGFRRHDESLNGFLISALIGLRAAEATALVDAAYASGRVDETVNGELSSVRRLLRYGYDPVWSPPVPTVSMPLTRAQRRAAEREQRKAERPTRRR